MLCKDCTIKVLCVASVAVNSSAIQLFLVYPVCWVLFTLNDVTVLDSRQMFSAHCRFIGLLDLLAHLSVNIYICITFILIYLILSLDRFCFVCVFIYSD